MRIYCYRKGRYDYNTGVVLNGRTMRDVTRTIITSEINPVQTIRTEEPRCNYIPAYINMRYVRFEISGWRSGVFLSEIYGPFVRRPLLCIYYLPRDHCTDNIIYLCNTYAYTVVHAVRPFRYRYN